MVVRFTWQRREWTEAYLLSTREGYRTTDPVPMGYLTLGLMALGGLGELAGALHQKRAAILQDSLSPMLMLVCCMFTTVLVSVFWLRRRERLRDMPAIPRGEQQVTVHELGWGMATGEHTAPNAQVQPWSELRGLRTGRRVLALLTWDGSTVGVPLRVLSADQGGWLERLLERKVPRLV